MNRKQAPNRTKEVDTESQMMFPEQRMPFSYYSLYPMPSNSLIACKTNIKTLFTLIIVYFF
jgi:hypothetical protein